MFRNTGNEPIEIGDIERSCGCMTPELQKKQLAPGESGLLRVPVELDRQEPGFREFQLTVHYKDPQPKQETLLIKAVFPQPQVVVNPLALDITQKTDKPFPTAFRVIDHREKPLNVLNVESTTALVTPSIEDVENGGRTTRVALNIAGGIPEGVHRVLVCAHTDDPARPRVLFPMRIKGRERRVPVVVEPSMVRMKAGQPEPSSVRIALPVNWKMSHVDVFPEQLEVTWDEPTLTDQGRLLDLSLKLTDVPQGIREGVVTVHANDGSEMISVRVEIVSGD